MDLNLIRSIVTVVAFATFAWLAVRAWRAGKRGSFAEAEALPFEGEPAQQPFADGRDGGWRAGPSAGPPQAGPDPKGHEGAHAEPRGSDNVLVGRGAP